MTGATLFSSHESHIIAEIGVNHEGSLARAKSMIKAAALSGCKSVKLQHYRASSLASPNAASYWSNDEEPETNQFALFSKGYEFEVSELKELADFSNKECNVAFGLSVFDHREIRQLASIVDYFKVASGDLTHKTLIQEIAKSGRPSVISTGASKIEEVARAIAWIRDSGGPIPVILQCTLAYPALLGDANISSIGALRKEFPEAILGVSDHIPEAEMNRFVLAWALGARVFEKHFSDVPGSSGNDHYHSFGAAEISSLNETLNSLPELWGGGSFMLDSEAAARIGARRSLHFATDLEQGHTLLESDFEFLRPGDGIAPEKALSLVGRKLSLAVKKFQKVEMSALEP